MTDIVDCPALHTRHIDKGYPFGDRVPKSVKLRHDVTDDEIGGIGITTLCGEPRMFAGSSLVYPAWTNSYGAISAVLPDGRRLGLKPGEFEVVEWHGAAA